MGPFLDGIGKWLPLPELLFSAQFLVPYLLGYGLFMGLKVPDGTPGNISRTIGNAAGPPSYPLNFASFMYGVLFSFLCN